MREFMRRALLVVGLCAGAAVPSFGDEPTGDVSGAVEKEQIAEIQRAQALEGQAQLTLQQAIESGSPLTGPQRDSIADALTGARNILMEVSSVLEDTSSAVNASMSTLARGRVDSAIEKDQKAIELVGNPNSKPDKIQKQLVRANTAKAAAIYFLQGTPTTPKDEAALAANPAPPTATIDPDVAAHRNLVVVTKSDIATKRGDARNGRGRGKKQKRPRGPYGPGVVEAAAVPANYYYSFTGTSTTPGYTFKSIGRPLMGPFDVRFQVGAFDPNATEDTGSACVELDLQGSDPLQFLAVCGRRIDGGVQVFAQSHEGQHGSVFLPGSRIAQVRIVYTGTTFTCYAGDGQGLPDFLLSQFATYNFTQGSTPLVAGLGASGLLKGAEIGLDEIEFIPR